MGKSIARGALPLVSRGINGMTVRTALTVSTDRDVLMDGSDPQAIMRGLWELAGLAK